MKSHSNRISFFWSQSNFCELVNTIYDEFLSDEKHHLSIT
jgi:hypothetical protein